MGFFDLIFETQLMQFLKTNKSHFFPQVHEEIFVVNVENKTVLNYLAIVEYPNMSLISMLTSTQTQS